MFAAATSFFARTNISQNYNIGSAPGAAGGSRASTPGPPGSAGPAAVPTFRVGPWRVQAATHKSTLKRVSVWDLDKRSQWMERLNPAARDRALEVLKAEASALGRLRHPSILEMVEPLEETRGELIFATEPVLSSLHLSIPGASRSSLVELDEIEIQKGILQLCKGLSFLHTSARMIHSNINPESVIINSAGDWKVGGLGLTISLLGPDGKATPWEFPTFDGRLDTYVQRSFDYMAPEYGLDEELKTGSDLYSMGCLIYAVHSKGNPPFKNHGSLSGLRDNAGKPVPGMERLDRDLQALLNSLITRHAHNRPSPTDLPSHAFFSSLPISTLNFLDRSTFATKSREEKISFMKGLASVLPRFSEGLRVRKILPSLLEEMKDTHLLPYILPNVFAISTALTPTQFGTLVLPSLKPLFMIKEPPQNMLTLLENLTMLQEKTDKAAFREHVLPLVYNALESEHAIVQERALKCVPGLCDSIDYAEVQGVLFPRVALVFSKTRILSVKVATLETFFSMVKTLDQTSLTQKLVPLLSKIRTKEPGVMMATLAVQEAMGMKVDREAVATLVLPQLWGMSIGPLLSVTQFERFMAVIRKLGDRVEKEHNQFLRDSQRLEDRSTVITNGAATNGASGPVDFASLVGQAGASVKQDSAANPSWGDDPWGTILAGTADTPRAQSPALQSPVLQTQASPNLPSSPKPYTPTAPPRGGAPPVNLGLGVQRAASSSNHTVSSYRRQPPSAYTSVVQPVVQPSPQSNFANFPPPPLVQPLPPSFPTTSFTPLQPVSSPAPPAWAPQASTPNYNIMTPATSPPPLSMASPPLFAASPSMGAMLAPSKPATPSWQGKKVTKDDWGDFDPLA